MTSQPNSGQIFFCGDVHGHFQHIIEAVQEHAPPAVVLLGDIQAQRPLEQELAYILDKTEIWFIHGNHDTDSVQDHDNLFESALADKNLDGRVVEIAGVRIAGLGGIFRGQVWRPPEPGAYDSKKEYVRIGGRGNRWRDGLSLKHRSTIFPDDYNRLAELHADVLVTHEAPAVHPHGFDAINQLARQMQAKITFHGHHHDSLDYSRQWNELGHKAYGVGFCGITALDGTVIRTGDFDTVRKTRGDYGLPFRSIAEE